MFDLNEIVKNSVAHSSDGQTGSLFYSMFRNLHWNFNVFRNFLLQSRQKPYRSSSTYPIPLIPDYIPVEAALKIIVPLCGILMNLFGPEGRRLVVFDRQGGIVFLAIMI
jgi:hypothetical protein